MPINDYRMYPDRRLAAEAAAGAVLSRIGARFLRKRVPPSLSELAALTDGMHGGVESLLAGLGGPNRHLSPGDLTTFASEHGELRQEVASRYGSRTLPLPERWAVEKGTSFLLYAFVRSRRPATVIEIGVGNGQSSFYILRALQANAYGRLHSFDIVPEAGGLVSESERHRWDFCLIDPRDSQRSLIQHLEALPAADLGFHDAGHLYLPQIFDFNRLWERLNPAGTLIIDDVDSSYAFIDFCRALGQRPEILIDSRKAVGLVSRSAAGNA